MIPEERLQVIEASLTEIKQLLRRILFKLGEESVDQQIAYLNVKEAAKLLGLHPTMIYTKCSNANLPHIRVGKFYKFRKDELLAWMNESKVADTNVDNYVNSYLQKHALRG